MQIDNQAAVEGLSKGAYTQLTLTLDLFIGGHRNFDEIAKNANLYKSFKGCIQKVHFPSNKTPSPYPSPSLKSQKYIRYMRLERWVPSSTLNNQTNIWWWQGELDAVCR